MENRSIPVCIHKNKQLVISGAIKPTKCYFIQDWVPEVISIADFYIPAESSNSIADNGKKYNCLCLLNLLFIINAANTQIKTYSRQLKNKYKIS